MALILNNSRLPFNDWQLSVLFKKRRNNALPACSGNNGGAIRALAAEIHFSTFDGPGFLTVVPLANGDHPGSADEFCCKGWLEKHQAKDDPQLWFWDEAFGKPVYQYKNLEWCCVLCPLSPNCPLHIALTHVCKGNMQYSGHPDNRTDIIAHILERHNIGPTGSLPLWTKPKAPASMGENPTVPPPYVANISAWQTELIEENSRLKAEVGDLKETLATIGSLCGSG